jgi:threonine/homoserine/homoserine lactone efflux protein
MLAALLGFVFGFVGSMPVAGPVAVLVFGRGIEDRSRSALYLAAGSALAESVYAYLAFWGFSAFLTQYRWIEPVSTIAAALILCGLGLRFLLKRAPSERAALAPRDPRVGNKRSFALGFTVTALNPALIATWTAAVTTVFSLQIVDFDESGALPFSIGAATGIVTWFATLLYLLNRFRSRLSPRLRDRLVRVMGVLLLVLGLGLAARFAYSNLFA